MRNQVSSTSVQHQAAQNEPSVFTNESVFWIEDNSIKKEIA